jgi:hypothetical protein
LFLRLFAAGFGGNQDAFSVLSVEEEHGGGGGYSDKSRLLPRFYFLLLLVLLSLQAEGTEYVGLEVKRIISTFASKNLTVNSTLLWATQYLCFVF